MMICIADIYADIIHVTVCFGRALMNFPDPKNLMEGQTCSNCTTGTIRDSDFRDNAVLSTMSSGGAIFDVGSDGLDINNCTFLRNTVRMNLPPIFPATARIHLCSRKRNACLSPPSFRPEMGVRSSPSGPTTSRSPGVPALRTLWLGSPMAAPSRSQVRIKESKAGPEGFLPSFLSVGTERRRHRNLRCHQQRGHPGRQLSQQRLQQHHVDHPIGRSGE